MNHEPRITTPPESEGVAEERYSQHRKALADAIQRKVCDLVQHAYLIADDDREPDQDMSESYARGQIRCIKQATTELEILLLNFVRSTEEKNYWAKQLKEPCNDESD